MIIIRRLSMICPNCKGELPEGLRFCKFCGTPIAGAGQTAENQFNPQAQNFNVNTPVNRPGDATLVDPNERVLASLKNGFSANLLSGEGLVNEDAVVTDKRLYYNATHGIINVVRREEKIDIDDITGTKIVNVRPLGLLLFALLIYIVLIIIAIEVTEEVLAGLALPVFLVIAFIFGCKKHLRIEYAGGVILFSVRKYKMENVRQFQKAIHLVKDAHKKKQ